MNSQVHRQGDPILSLSTQVLQRGQDHIVSFEGTSQFTALGVSACGLAAFNFARIAFRIEHDSQSLSRVLNELSTRDVIEEIVAICAGWSSNTHLEVDDIHNLPIFDRCLALDCIKFGHPDPEHFEDLLQSMKCIDKSAVMIITRPPEIIACLKLSNQTVAGDNPVFVIFDSHPRPSHPHGAGLSFSTSIESTARTLSESLPTMDANMFSSADFGWQAQLLANCSAHVYVARRASRRKDHEAAIIQSSLVILDLRTQISALRSENGTLDVDIGRLESEADHLRTCIRQEQALQAKQDASSSLATFANSVLGRSFGLISHAVAGPSGTYSRSVDPPSATAVKRPAPPSPAWGATGAKSIFAHNPPPVPFKMPATYEEDVDFEDDSSIDSDDNWMQSVYLAHQLREEFDHEDRQRRQQHARLQKKFDSEDRQSRLEHARLKKKFDSEDLQSHLEHARLQRKFDSEDRQSRLEHARLQRKLDSEDRQFRLEQARVALQLQNEFDAEDRKLRQEQSELARYMQTTFQCPICMEELPEDDVAKIDECVHRMCRSCLRNFVFSKIEEHRYPIFCPMCTADLNHKGQPGVISRLLIEQLGVSEEQCQILTEMELAEFTIQIHCRGCRRPAFVDRQDYSEVMSIVCPQSDCHHVWCKKCEQTIVVDGPKHSCDGSSELDHLMKEKGWKHCPNCTTPIQKETGCHHMACISPGCNTHFCYVCGGMIVRSALTHEIGASVSAHYRQCQLFDVPPN